MGLPATMNTISEQDELEGELERKDTQISKDSQTASDFIDKQLELEADAREILPYKFDSCSYSLGPLRQSIFACLTCSPPPASLAQLYTSAGICYSCSIQCHGDHTLVELFTRRNFVCDCGTTRMPSHSPCMLRNNNTTGTKGAHSQEASKSNHYNHNFQNHFCGCGEEYDAQKEKGTMFQCIGLGTVETGGCGEDWWHPECLMGLPRDWQAKQKSNNVESNVGNDNKNNTNANDEEETAPPGFPQEDDFETFVCYKCVESNPWIKQYAGTTGFLQPLFREDETKPNPPPVPAHIVSSTGMKRKASESDDDLSATAPSKRVREAAEDGTGPSRSGDVGGGAVPPTKHEVLPPAPAGSFSLFMKEDFREHLCHCSKCYPNLIPHQQLVEEEEIYEPSVSDSEDSNAGPGSGTRSHGTGSLLDRGEAALSGVDRVRAIEGVMVYNHLRDKVKAFLKPYAESGKPVGAEDIKAYFEKLRGDEAAIKEAGSRPLVGEEDDDKTQGSDRKEQGGY